MARFSIILPVKNGGAYARECISSILSQTVPGFELLILDNSSKDDLQDWIKQLNDSRIKLYPVASDLSIEQNWKRILSVPRNEFMTIIGHDDLLHPGYLAAMEALIRQHPAATLYQAHFNFIDGKGDIIRPCQPMPETITAARFLEAEFDKTLDSMGTGYMMRSTDYDAVGGISPDYPNLMFADYELWMKLIMKGYMAVTKAICFSYRLHNNTSKHTNGEIYQQAFLRYAAFLVSCRESDSSVADVIRRKGAGFIYYFCQSLSHRLLRTPLQLRKTRVRDYVSKCAEAAKILLPGISFHPYLRPGILAAWLLDNKAGLIVFGWYKKLRARQ